jgi:ABC-2 type transport system ATP-binding protein
VIAHKRNFTPNTKYFFSADSLPLRSGKHFDFYDLTQIIQQQQSLEGELLQENFAISIKSLQKRFGPFEALKGISLDVKRGEIFGLLGPNGAGKTTTMRILSCLIKPTSGSVLVDGINVADDKKTIDIRRRIGLLTENPNIYERLSADQNLRFFASAYGVKDEIAKTRITELLRNFELIDRRNDRVGTFSKGMKQKLAIARALIHKPSILLLDEPTSAVDAESAKSIREVISETAKEYDHTVLLSTHNLDDASKLCDQIAILSQGKILACGSESEIAEEMRKSRNRNDLQFLNQIKLNIELFDVGSFSVKKLLLQNIPGIKDVSLYRNARYGFEFSLDPELAEIEIDMLISKIVSFIVGSGGEVTMVQLQKPTLEDIYLGLMSDSKGTVKTSK